MQQQRGADADRRPLHRGDQRLAERRDGVDEPGGRRIVQPARHRQEILDVVARGEGVALRPDQHGADRRACGGVMQRRGQGVIHRAQDGVLLLRPVEPQFKDAVRLPHQNGVGQSRVCQDGIAHAGCSVAPACLAR